MSGPGDVVECFFGGVSAGSPGDKGKIRREDDVKDPPNCPSHA